MDDGRSAGLAMCRYFEDYRNGAIKKHELTRPDKRGGSHESTALPAGQHRTGLLRFIPISAEIDALVEGVVKGAAPDCDS